MKKSMGWKIGLIVIVIGFCLWRFLEDKIVLGLDLRGGSHLVLEVQTDEEDDWVESEEYEIDAPTVGGFVYVYNDSGVLLATYGGEDALLDAEDDGQFARDDAEIVVAFNGAVKKLLLSFANLEKVE